MHFCKNDVIFLYIETDYFRKSIMRKISHGKLMWSALVSLSMGFAGCNLFHPTGSHDAESDDAAALTLEGYQEYQNSNFEGARKFFDRALRADSGYSEAWIGLSKSVLNTQEGLKPFELISLVKSDSAGILDISDDSAAVLSKGIDSVMYFLNLFVQRDTTDKTDKKVRFKDIADSYTILQFTKAAFRIRNMKTKITNVVSTGESGMQMDLSTLNDLGDSLKPFLNDMASAAEAIKAAPENASEIMKSFYPDAKEDYADENAYKDASIGLANMVIQLNERAENTSKDRHDVFFKFGNKIDDDGDGCIDEEAIDGYDNDGDGEIDEDGRDSRTMVLIKDAMNYDLTKAQIDSLKFIGSYQSVDIDMNGKFGPADESLPEDKWEPKDAADWQFVIRDPNERDDKDNHLLKFAKNLKFAYNVTKEKELDKLIANKEKARKDTDINNIKYDLKWRQKNIGGCWANYSEEDFKKWFEGRDAE